MARNLATSHQAQTLVGDWISNARVPREEAAINEIGVLVHDSANRRVDSLVIRVVKQNMRGRGEVGKNPPKIGQDGIVDVQGVNENEVEAPAQGIDGLRNRVGPPQRTPQSPARGSVASHGPERTA